MKKPKFDFFEIVIVKPDKLELKEIHEIRNWRDAAGILHEWENMIKRA